MTMLSFLRIGPRPHDPKCDHPADLVYRAMTSAPVGKAEHDLRSPRLERDLSPFFPVDIARLVISYVSFAECFLVGYIGRTNVNPQITWAIGERLQTVYVTDSYVGQYDCVEALIAMLEGNNGTPRPYDSRLRLAMADALK
jgi:hypothetical protein